MNFASDNVGPAAPEIMQAMMQANAAPQMPYGNDPFTRRAEALIREIFEAPEASVHLVSTGTAANALALSVLARPFDAIFCHELAHIEVDECGAPEFFTGGAKLRRVGGAEAKMTPQTLAQAIAAIDADDVHSVQHGPVSVTQLTELGSAYSTDALAALCDVARGAGVATHLDGARFANAAVALGCSAAEMTWKAGIDAVSFGGTKNGCLGVEAVVLFDPRHARELALRRKRAGHLWSKGKFLGAQMAAYLEGGLWLDLARKANDRMRQLVDGLAALPEARVEVAPAGNLMYLELPRSCHDRAFAHGAAYTLHGAGADDGPDTAQRARVVCDWSKTPEEVETLLNLWRG